LFLTLDEAFDEIEKRLKKEEKSIHNKQMKIDLIKDNIKNFSK
jgi:hypothetical protein